MHMKTMKIFNGIVAAMLLLVAACDDGGIDPISRVDPGPDESAPVVKINYPTEGTLIRVKEDVTSINIQLEVTDDIEISSIEVLLDGTKIGTFNQFKDYRRALTSYEYDQLTNGEHTLTVNATDVAGKTTVASVNFEKVEPYKPVYDGEIFYMPFDGDFLELVNIRNATKVGSPVFSEDAVGGTRAYKGAQDGYLTLPTEGLLGDEFSAVLWYKLNANPDRAGILTVSPPDEAKPATPNNRTSGFRLFRENAAGKQRVKLNVGNGSADNWFDGGENADLDPAVNEWVHIAFTIGQDKCAVYINGVVVSENTYPGVSWEGCDILSIASGAPRFTEWNHLSDQSLIDELRLFNRVLTQEEIQAMMAD